MPHLLTAVTRALAARLLAAPSLRAFLARPWAVADAAIVLTAALAKVRTPPSQPAATPLHPKLRRTPSRAADLRQRLRRPRTLLAPAAPRASHAARGPAQVAAGAGAAGAGAAEALQSAVLLRGFRVLAASPRLRSRPTLRRARARARATRRRARSARGRGGSPPDQAHPSLDR
jgi:hypothetical protein